MPPQPTDSDVWFGKAKHEGTKAFRKAVEKARETFPDEDFSPTVGKAIKKSLKGRLFFNKDGTEANKAQIKKQMQKAFNATKKE